MIKEELNKKGMVNMKNKILEEAYNGSYYTITGCGGDLKEWKDGYQKMLDEQEIGKINKWVEFKGKDMNNEFELTGEEKYPDELNFLAFSLDNLDIGKLSMFKLRMQDRWFDDIVNNLTCNLERN